MHTCLAGSCSTLWELTFEPKELIFKIPTAASKRVLTSVCYEHMPAWHKNCEATNLWYLDVKDQFTV